MKALTTVAGALVIVGGLNWGLVAIGEFDLVAWLAGEDVLLILALALLAAVAAGGFGGPTWMRRTA
jgi:uncharacterized membrane protein YuzA (DUF378 family)